MTQKNDDRIMLLKQKVDSKRNALKGKSDRFTPITNCLLVFDKVTYNLHVDASQLLLLRLNSLAMSAQDLGIDPKECIISGYSLIDWIEDIKSFLAIQRYRKEKSDLAKLEKQLDSLLSEDKRTELELDSIAALLGE